jgi:hypothetical protein
MAEVGFSSVSGAKEAQATSGCAIKYRCILLFLRLFWFVIVLQANRTAFEFFRRLFSLTCFLRQDSLSKTRSDALYC